MKSIYLCGFMGCGKSYIGSLLAEDKGMPFVDLDRYIVEKEGRSIPEIFEQSGEPYFRQLEAKYITELEGYVVATGGGALINENTALYANTHGITVFLDADFELCYERIKDDVNRPLVMNNTKDQLRELFEKRREIYERHSQVVVSVKGVEEETLKSINSELEHIRRTDLKGM